MTFYKGFVYIGAKATSLPHGPYRIQLNVHVAQRQKSKKNSLSLSVNKPYIWEITLIRYVETVITPKLLVLNIIGNLLTFIVIWVSLHSEG